MRAKVVSSVLQYRSSPGVRSPGLPQIGANGSAGKGLSAAMLKPSLNKSPDLRRVVYVVDDDVDVREGLRSLLDSVHLGCEVFASAKDFLNRKPSDAVSCVILDVRLPGPSGLDVQAEL